MISEGELVFQMGAIMLLAFIGAALASKLNQSVMIGYIVVGVFIGPSMHVSIFGFEYNGLIHETSLIEAMSKIGLILLLFFVGLEFSLSRLMRTKTPAFLLAFINISMNMFAGFVVGKLFGWPLIDTFFLAGVMAMNSTAIAAKALLDMKRINNPETELIMAFEVVGTFVAMIVLTVGSGLVVTENRTPISLWQMAIGMMVFISFFILIAVWLVPRIMHHFEKIRSDELFILFALGLVFVSAALAEVSFVPSIIGAFFVGMLFAESRIAERLQDKLVSIKDTFVAIFFISFGMLIDPAYFPIIVPMLIVAVPLILFNDVIFGSIVVYLMGYSSRAATAVGTTIAGRAEESVLYAAVGSKVKIATKGAELVPFAGAFCFVMSAITPALMQRSAKIASFLSKFVPRHISFSASLVSRTLSKAVLPASLPLFKKARRTGFMLVMFFISIMAMLVTYDLPFIVVSCVGAVTIYFFAVSARDEIDAIVRHVNYMNLGLGESSMKQPITELVSKMIAGVAVTIFLIAAVWKFYWYGSFIILLGYAFYCIYILRRAAIDLEMFPHPEQRRKDEWALKRTSLPKVSKMDLERNVLQSKAHSKDHIKHRSRILRRALEDDDGYHFE